MRTNSTKLNKNLVQNVKEYIEQSDGRHHQTTLQAPIHRRRYYILARKAKDETGINGLCSLTMKVFIDTSDCCVFSLNIQIFGCDWDSKNQKVINHPLADRYNSIIEMTKRGLEEKYLNMVLMGENVTAMALVHTFSKNGKQAEKLQKINPYIDYVFSEFFKAKKDEIKYFNKYYINRYLLTLEYVSKFHKTKQLKRSLGDKIDLGFANTITANLLTDSIDSKFLEGFANHLRAIPMEDSTIYKHIKNIKQVIHWAECEGIVMKNKTKNFTFKHDKKYDLTHLTQIEMAHLIAFDFGKIPNISPKVLQSLNQERDRFVISAYTGQHHGDLMNPKNFEIYQSESDKRLWLRGNRNKTNGEYNFPLHPVAQMVIEKYKGLENLPKMSNVKRNLYLKIIAVYTGINKHLTTKTGRKTLASYLINDLSASIETVALVLGHKSTEQVKHYGAINERRVSKEIDYRLDPNAQLGSTKIVEPKNEVSIMENFAKMIAFEMSKNMTA